jgi:hypothetical protein
VKEASPVALVGDASVLIDIADANEAVLALIVVVVDGIPVWARTRW